MYYIIIISVISALNNNLLQKKLLSVILPQGTNEIFYNTLLIRKRLCTLSGIASSFIFLQFECTFFFFC